MNLDILGIASGICAEKRGSELGVWDMYYSLPEFGLRMDNVLFTDDPSRKIDAMNTWYSLSNQSLEYIKNTQQEKKHLFITGDHSNGFSVWNGMLEKYKGELGLIWVDAHLDAHTLKTTESKNIHGFPVSHLLGKGDTLVSQLNTYPLDPKNLCFIGTRDYEDSEMEFVKSLGIKMYFMKDLTDENLPEVIQEAIEYVSQNTSRFGVSIDMDGFDPIYTPGTGCYCPNGLPAQVVIDSLKSISSHSKFCGLELSEFDPLRDNEKKTKSVMVDLIKSVFDL